MFAEAADVLELQFQINISSKSTKINWKKLEPITALMVVVGRELRCRWSFRSLDDIGH